MRKLTTNEKVLIGMALISLIFIAISWKRISTDAKRGFDHYFKEQKK